MSLSDALLKLAENAKESDLEKKPEWPGNLKTELPKALEAQKQDAPTLTGREVEAACVASFIFSQPIGEQAELSDLRWLLAPACEQPAVLNNGLLSWAKKSWYLEECESTEASTGVPKYWRLGPKPNLNQLHDSHRRRVLAYAKGEFDDLVRTRCAALTDGCAEEGIKFHRLPESPADVEDDGQFRLVILGADFAGYLGSTPNEDAAAFIRKHSSDADVRTYQNIVIIITPSVSGLQQAEQQLADWRAWKAIEESPQFKDLDSIGQGRVRKAKLDTFKDAQIAVKNAYELALYIDREGSVQSRKITMGTQSLLSTLLQEKELRLFKEQINAETIMPPNALYPVWPADDPSVRVSELYQEFGKQPRLPKLLSNRTVLRTIEDAVRRGVLALRCQRSDGSQQWYWRSPIEMEEWEKLGEAWLPAKATLNTLSATAVVPDSLRGLWHSEDVGVKLSTLSSWFDGNHFFEEETQPGYPPERRPIPKVESTMVQHAVGKAVTDGHLWLVYGNDSVYQEAPTQFQLDSEACLYRPPAPLAPIDLLPTNLPAAWRGEKEPSTTIEALYTELKTARGKPWPAKAFVDTVNAALGHGMLQRARGEGTISSLKQDAAVELIIKEKAQPKGGTEGPKHTAPGRRATSTAALSVTEFQDLADRIHEVTKPLAGCDPQIEVRVTIKSKTEVDLGEANQVLDNIKNGWRFG